MLEGGYATLDGMIISNQSSFSFGLLPAYIGTVGSPLSGDLKSLMSWGQRRSDGLFGVLDWPPLELVYTKNHNQLIGRTWEQHLSAFATFTRSWMKGDVLEIGSGHGLLPAAVMDKHSSPPQWHTIEPNPLQENSFGLQINGWFPSDLPANIDFETIVHSHVVEHQPNPLDFVRKHAESLDLEGRVIVSWPNMIEMANHLDLNFLMFEHLTFLPQAELTQIFEHFGFAVLASETFSSHSIFMALEKVDEPSNDEYVSSIQPSEFGTICRSYQRHLEDFSSRAGEFFNASSNPNFVFGAHVFTQYLLANGLSEDIVAGLLDNNSEKQGQRLYGTNLQVFNPRGLESWGPVDVLVPMGSYEQEVLEDLMEHAAVGSRFLGKRVGLHEK